MPATNLSEADLRRKLAIYYVADPEQTERDILTVVDEAIVGGATSVQLRTKRTDGREMFNLAVAMVRRCQEKDVLFFVNDRVDIGIACGADGVHIGAKDLPLPATRALTGDGLIIGYSPVDASDAASAGARAPTTWAWVQSSAPSPRMTRSRNLACSCSRGRSRRPVSPRWASAASRLPTPGRSSAPESMAWRSSVRSRARDPRRATESLALAVNLALIER